ncbi:unnamed protein product [Lathyrus oleraceus]
MEMPSYLYLYPIQEDEVDVPPHISDAFIPIHNLSFNENKTFSPKKKLTKKIGHWSKREHRLFLEGLERYGHGNWKKISRHIVSKSSTQVASYAQKYFIRKKKERRRSFDNIASFVEFFNFIQT